MFQVVSEGFSSSFRVFYKVSGVFKEVSEEFLGMTVYQSKWQSYSIRCHIQISNLSKFLGAIITCRWGGSGLMEISCLSNDGR